MNELNKENDPKKKPIDFKIDIDPKIGESLQGGLDMIQKVFAGIVKAAHDAIGPENLRNLSAGQWLSTVAECLEQVATACRSGADVPADKVGELACYLERLDEELEGSKVAGQRPAFRQRLEAALQLLNSPTPDAAGARRIAESAGFFQAAAKSAIPLNMTSEKNKP